MNDLAFWGLMACGAILILFGLKRGTGHYIPLSRRQPAARQSAKPELGLEAVDHEALARSHRQNASLERGVSWLGGAYSQADIVIPPEADDADYARRYDRAHNRKTPRRVK